MYSWSGSGRGGLLNAALAAQEQAESAKTKARTADAEMLRSVQSQDLLDLCIFFSDYTRLPGTICLSLKFSVTDLCARTAVALQGRGKGQYSRQVRWLDEARPELKEELLG